MKILMSNWVAVVAILMLSQTHCLASEIGIREESLPFVFSQYELALSEMIVPAKTVTKKLGYKNYDAVFYKARALRLDTPRIIYNKIQKALSALALISAYAVYNEEAMDESLIITLNGKSESLKLVIVNAIRELSVDRNQGEEVKEKLVIALKALKDSFFKSISEDLSVENREVILRALNQTDTPIDYQISIVVEAVGLNNIIDIYKALASTQRDVSDERPVYIRLMFPFHRKHFSLRDLLIHETQVALSQVMALDITAFDIKSLDSESPVISESVEVNCKNLFN